MIETLVRFGDEFQSVSYQQPQPGVFKYSVVYIAEELLRDIHYLAVEFHHRDLLDAGVFECFLRRPSIAPADD